MEARCVQGMSVESGGADRAGAHVVRTWFSGVRLEVHSEQPLPWRRSGDPQAPPRGDEPVLAQVRCVVHCIDATAPPDRALRWSWSDGQAQVRVGARAMATVHQASAGYTASVTNSRGLDEALSAVAFPVLEREGGIILHAAGAELDGRAVLFLGPSGAGKSTAVSMLAPAPLFGVDRAAVFQAVDGRWWVCSLPGGNNDRNLPLSQHRCLPLAGLFVVTHWGEPEHAPECWPLSGADALSRVFAALLPNPSREAHRQGLDCVARLLAGVPVYALRSVLGRALDPCIQPVLKETAHGRI